MRHTNGLTINVVLDPCLLGRVHREAMLTDFEEASCFPVTNDGAPLTCAVCDTSEELVWSASGSGMIYSHLLPTAEPYSAFRMDVNGTPPLGIFPTPYGLIALAHDAAHFFAKGGLRQAEVRLEELLGATCGCLVPGNSTSHLAVVSDNQSTEAPSHSLAAQLSLLDLNTAAIASTLELEAPASIARYEPRMSLLCLSGIDGSVSTYDLRAGGAKAAGRCTLFPSKSSVVCDLDVAGNSLCASALRSQLGPRGTMDFVFDSTLRSLDLRTMRPTAEIFFAPGAMRLKWYYGAGSPQVCNCERHASVPPTELYWLRMSDQPGLEIKPRARSRGPSPWPIPTPHPKALINSCFRTFDPMRGLRPFLRCSRLRVMASFNCSRRAAA